MDYSPGFQQEVHASNTSTYSQTHTVTNNVAENNDEQAPVLRLRLQKPKNMKKVGWNSNTVDNEHMGKKKSKCCCIYKKPTVFGESSSESEGECENCFGHPEKKTKNCKKDHNSDNNVNFENPNDCNPQKC